MGLKTYASFAPRSTSIGRACGLARHDRCPQLLSEEVRFDPIGSVPFPVPECECACHGGTVAEATSSR